MPTAMIQKPTIMLLENILEIDDPEELKPQNHATKTMTPLDRKSTTGTSFRRRGGEEYSNNLVAVIG
jgi:hypothetical protein